MGRCVTVTLTHNVKNNLTSQHVGNKNTSQLNSLQDVSSGSIFL